MKRPDNIDIGQRRAVAAFRHLIQVGDGAERSEESDIRQVWGGRSNAPKGHHRFGPHGDEHAPDTVIAAQWDGDHR